jgi:hypothetical protein
MLFSPLRTYQFTVSYRALLTTISLAAALAAIGVASPATAGADATIAPPPTYSSAPGLPDNRIYEQVSPTDKNGNQAGANTNTVLGFGGIAHYALAAADGNGVLFEGSGPMGETAAGYNLDFVAQRSAAGWSTRAIMPRAQELVFGTLGVQPGYVDPSADLSHVMFESGLGAYATPPNAQCGSGHRTEDQLYLSGPDPFVAATWLARPEISNPIEVCAIEGESGAPVGGTPDFSTVYFTFPGTLLPKDASRAPYQTITESAAEATEPWGFYEYSGGVLSEAGVLPDGSLDPFGAVPAASGHGRAITGNQIADEGKRAFFVSPDPAAVGSCKTAEEGKGASPAQAAAACAPQLYVRENGEKTVLVSRTLIPEVNGLPPEANGLPAPAPDGALGFTGSTQTRLDSLNTSFVYASPDGSQAFFESEDKLTSAAPATMAGDQAHVSVSGSGESGCYITGGTFTLTVTVGGSIETTAPITYNATEAGIQSALGALSNVGVGNVTVAGALGISTGPSFTATFGFGLENVAMTMDSSSLVETIRGEACSLSFSVQNQRLKTYDFNVNTGSLTYLPGVVGQIVTSSPNGSSFAFVSPEAAASSAQLDLWSAGPAAGGTVTPITQLTGKPVRGYGKSNEVMGVDVPVARMSSDGSAVVFLSSSLVGLSGDFNSGTNLEQVYRYDVATNTLGCVSCAPAGVTPESSAELSVLQANESGNGSYTVDRDKEVGLVDERGISSDADRIFFDTADPLVPQVTNTRSTTVGSEGRLELQGRNVYEWENGTVYLLSSGKSPRSSYFLDNSENGSDVFFATTDGLVPGDTDGAYDVYDARIPHPGDNPPPAAVPCEGSVCQGPPRVQSPLAAPPRATLPGSDNLTPEVTPPPPPKKTTKKTVKCKKGLVKKKNKCVKKPKPKKAKKTDRRAK